MSKLPFLLAFAALTTLSTSAMADDASDCRDSCRDLYDADKAECDAQYLANQRWMDADKASEKHESCLDRALSAYEACLASCGADAEIDALEVDDFREISFGRFE